jgi:hypothetical protein
MHCAVSDRRARQWYGICWSPNWNEPQTDSGTPRFGILTNPYPNRFGESQNRFGDCFFFVFFLSRTRSAFSHQTDNNTANTSAIPICNARDASGAPPSSRRALTPRQVGAHPARVGARLRLDAPQRGGHGGGVGSDAVTGGAGADVIFGKMWRSAT